MLFANINGIKSQAFPKAKALCTFCNESMIAKCGKVKTWHWAHKRIDACDSWYEPETEWHRNWKLVFGKEHCEIIVIKDQKKHIADIKTMNGWFIELQNSIISIETMEARESFYGEEMMWIVNGIKFKDNFKTFTPRTIHDNQYDDYSPEFEYYAKLHGFTPRYRPVGKANTDLLFEWKYSHSAWKEANRKIYIDFGKENLFCITSRTGDGQGRGFEISKSDFIKTYGGDITLVSKLILNDEK